MSGDYATLCSRLFVKNTFSSLPTMRQVLYTLTLFSVLFAVGCGGTVIQGTAKMADGTPIGQGTVFFHSGNDMYTATIRPDGTFSPGVMRDGDGIPPGVYRISVSGVFREGAMPPGDDDSGRASPEQIPLIASKYASPATSGLEIDTTKTRTIDLVLDPAER